MEPRLRSLLRGAVHRFECMTECVEMQELEVVQAIVLFIILVEVTADKVGEMDEARVNECSRGVTEDDRLEFRNGIEDGELDEMGNKLEPARRDSKKQLSP
jgi:hypothetical protein